MSSFTVQFDQVQLDAVKAMLNIFPDMAERVLYKSINKTLTEVKSDISEGVRRVVTADQETVDGKIRLSNASLKKLSGLVSLAGAPLPISKFPAIQEPWGVLARIYKAQPYRRITSSFLATMKSGHVGAFRRETLIQPAGVPVNRPWKRMPKAFRLPIEEMYGPSLGTILQSPPVMEPVLSKLGDHLDANLEDQTQRELARL